jgi:hypothetical protein
MEIESCSIGGERVAVRLAARAAYFEKDGWRRLDEMAEQGDRPIVALVRPVDPARARAEPDAREAPHYRGDLSVAA